MTATDLSAALAVLDEHLDATSEFPDDFLDFFALGHLRTLRAALSEPYVPGMVEVDPGAWDSTPHPEALLTVWTVDAQRVPGEVPTRHYFVGTSK